MSFRGARAASIGALIATALLGGCGGGKEAQSSTDTSIAVARVEGARGIYRINGDGCCLAPVTRAPQGTRDLTPAWSPDGKTIAFLRDTESKGELALHVVDAAGGESRAVPGGTAYGFGVGWSPDSDEIRFVGRDGIWTIEPSGAGARLLVRTVAFHFSSSADGKLAFVRPESGLHVFVADSDGTNIRRLTSTRYPLIDVYPSWSPDGKRLAYVELNILPLESLSYRPRIKIVDADGRGARTLIKLGGDARLSWSPDGDWIAFAGSVADKSGIFVVPVDGGTPRLLLEGAFEQPSWGTSSS